MKKKRKQLFGKFREGFRPLRAYRWKDGPIEIPVTTMPLFKLPIHASYVLYLAGYSRWIAKAYFRSALDLCRLFRVEPSLLLHPLDFMGMEDGTGLDFFPAMRDSHKPKCELVDWMFGELAKRFDVVPMRRHAEIANQRRLRVVNP